VDQGEFKWLLDMVVTRSCAEQTISISQTAHINKIAMCLGLENVHPVTTPLDKNVILSKWQSPMTGEGKVQMKDIAYLVAVGSLMYAAMGSCPDLTFTVAHLSQFLLNPGLEHWTAVQCVVCYLSMTRDMVLVLSQKAALTLQGWVDSD
jgi:hypothetical protein